MESKKINQLATELTPDLSDLTIIGDPNTGISKKITLSQMASLFTGTVEEYANFAAFPLVGTADTIYVAKDTNVLYRWDTSTSAYVVLSPNIIASLVFNDSNGFDGNIALVGSTATLTITTALTTGSVPFIGASGALSQDNANLFFDDTNNRLGINTNAPTTALDVFGSGIIGRINGTSTNNAFLGFASAGTNKWSVGNVQSDHRFRIYSEANSAELISVLQTGEVGIGIANPLTKLHIDGGATALIANLDANVSVAKSISFRSDNSARINLEVSGTESGSNAGADFFIRRYSDAGSLIDTPLTITRSTGGATFSGILTTPQVKAATSAGLSINANSGTQVADFGAGGSANMTLFGGLSGTSATFSSTATATAFIPSGATVPTNGMYLSAANTLNFATNTTNRLTILSTGNIGVNTSTPFGVFQVKVNTNNNVGFYPKTVNSIGMLGMETTNDAGTGNTPFAINSSSLYFLTQNVIAQIIDSSGNTGFGTTSIAEKVEIEGNLALRNGNTYSTSLERAIVYRSNTISYGVQPVGNINFKTSGDAASFMTFTTRNGAADYNERVRISQPGNLIVGSTTDNGQRLQVNGRVTADTYARSSGNVLAFTTAGVNYTIINTPFSGMICIRDNTTGGSALYLLDPNLGVNLIASTLTFTITFTYSGGTGTWVAARSGGVATNIGFALYGN